MDWNKSKTILIISLIVTNIFLFTALYVQKHQVKSLAENRSTVEKLLSEKHITLDTSLPEGKARANPLIVEAETQDVHLLNRWFFNGEGEVEYTDNEQTVIAKQNEKLTVSNGNSLIYENEISEMSEQNLDVDDAMNMAVSFLNKRQIDTADMKLMKTSKVGKFVELSFSKVYNDKLVMFTETTMRVGPSGVKRMERYWLSVREEGSGFVEISPASKAILTLLNTEQNYGKTVSSMQLCYHFNPKAQGYVSKLSEVSKGRAIPAWIVGFADGSSAIIDNY